MSHDLGPPDQGINTMLMLREQTNRDRQHGGNLASEQGAFRWAQLQARNWSIRYLLVA